MENRGILVVVGMLIIPIMPATKASSTSTLYRGDHRVYPVDIYHSSYVNTWYDEGVFT